MPTIRLPLRELALAAARRQVELWQARPERASGCTASRRAQGLAQEHFRKLNDVSMSEITVTLPDGSNRRVPAGTTPGEIAAGISPRLAKAALAAAVDDRLVDLSFPLQQDARVRIITPESPEGLHVYRHSTAHLLAAAVTNLFPGAQCGIGPATDEGFFYDFIVDRPFVPEDLEAIEKKMKDLAGQDLRYERQMLARDEAKQFFAGRGETLKVQLIDEKTEGQSEVSCYTIKDRDTFVDFCVGPACAIERPAEGVQAAEHLQRLLERGCAQPADAAHLRHRVLQRQGTAGAPAAPRRSEETRPSQGRQGYRTCSRSTHGRRARRSGSTRERRCTTRSPITCATCSYPPVTWS